MTPPSGRTSGPRNKSNSRRERQATSADAANVPMRVCMPDSLKAGRVEAGMNLCPSQKVVKAVLDHFWVARYPWPAWELARDRLAAFFTAQHPEWAPGEVRRQVARRLSRESG